MDGKDIVMFTLDNGVIFIPEKRCLVGQDKNVIDLSETSYRLLLLLIKGETDKQDLINQVWSEQRGAVSENSYYRQLYLLRKTFSKAGLSHSLIKTIPRKGVKYVGYVAKGVFQDSPLSEEYRKLTESIQNDERVEVEEISLSYPIQNEGGNQQKQIPEYVWYHSRSWNLFVSSLATLAVCWLTTLLFALFYLWRY